MSGLVRPGRFPWLAAAALAATACGGEPPPPAVDDSGAVISSGGEEDLNQIANERWEEGSAVFAEAEAEGFTPDRCERAGEKFSAAIEAQGGGFAEAQYMLGRLHEKCGDADEAEARYARALEIWPEFCEARVALGITQQRAGRVDEARRNFEQARDDSPRTCHEAYVNIAILQRQQGTEESQREAIANLRRALAIDANYLPAFNELALLYLERAGENRQMLDLAALVCRQGQLVDRDYAPIYNTWGLVHVRKNDIIQALRMFDRARSLDDSFYEAFMNFGQITLSFRGYEDARSSFGRAVELKPDSYDAHVGLGAAYRGLGDFEKAEEHYQRAKELDPGRPEAYYNLAVLHQDYVITEQAQIEGQIEVLREAMGFYDEFVAKADGDRLEETLEDVTRTCTERQMRQRRWRAACQPGRKQRVQQTLDALVETLRIQQEMEEQMAAAEAEAAENEGAGDGADADGSDAEAPATE